MQRRYGVAAVLLVLLAACDDDGPVAPPPQPSSGWTRVAGGIAHGTLMSAWVSPGGRIYTSDNLSILKFDGADWYREGNRGGFRDMWGASEREIYAVGPLVTRFDGTDWKDEIAGTGALAIWGDGSDVFTVGFAGNIYRRINGVWTHMVSPTSYMLLDVWGTSSSHVFAVGENGRIVHFDGREWSVVLSDAERTLRAVGGLSDSDVVAAGDGVITRFDGTEWKRVDTGLGNTKWVVVWPHKDALYVASQDGKVLRFRGDTWRAEPGCPPGIVSVCSSERHPVVAVDAAGDIHRMVGGRWESILGDVRGSNMAVVALDDGRALVAGTVNGNHFVRTYQGDELLGSTDFPSYANDLWADAPDNVYAVTYDQVFRFDGTQWEDLGHHGVHNARLIWGFTGDEVLVAGYDSTVAWYDGTTWMVESVPAEDGIRDLWAAGRDFVFAATDGRMLRYDGTSWSEWHEAMVPLRNVTGTSQTDVWSVSGGWVFHNDGAGWEEELIGIPGEDIVAIARNDVYVVGSYGKFAHFDGSAWTTDTMPALSYFGDAAASPSGNHIWLVGYANSILRLDP